MGDRALLRDVLERLEVVIGDWKVGYANSAMMQLIDLRDELCSHLEGEDASDT
jgi:hypothetical protein